jgi:hypothetical protein
MAGILQILVSFLHDIFTLLQGGGIIATLIIFIFYLTVESRTFEGVRDVEGWI